MKHREGSLTGLAEHCTAHGAGQLTSLLSPATLGAGDTGDMIQEPREVMVRWRWLHVHMS